MLYYNFTVWCVMLLRLLLGVGDIIIYVTHWQSGVLPHFLNALITVAMVLPIFLWLRRRQWRGVILLMLSYVYTSIYAVLVDPLLSGTPLQMDMLVANFIAFGLLTWATWIYFCKRRPLFTPYNDSMSSL